MSFLPPSGTPFSMVEDYPTATELNDAIQAGFTSGDFINAPKSGVIDQPADKMIVVGGGNKVTVNVPEGGRGDILVTGAGTRVNLTGDHADVQGTNLGGGGLIIETLQEGPGGVGTTPNLSPKDINFSASYASPADNDFVDTNALVGGDLDYDPQQTIAQAAGGLTSQFNFVFYGHGGSGDDLLTGSNQSDFLRGGAGNDQINAGGGNDLVRGGAGSDQIELGEGSDALYYTLDQIDEEENGSVDTIADFNAADDMVYFDGANIDQADVTIVGGAIEVKVGTRSLRIVSNGDDFTDSNIQFLNLPEGPDFV